MEYKFILIEYFQNLPNSSIYREMFKHIIEMIGHKVFSQAAVCDKMTRCVWIIQLNHHAVCD